MLKIFLGSHVVIFDNNPSEETIEIASMLAAYYSKFKNEEYVNVDRTLIKKCKKKYLVLNRA